jgi:hypothetical protein
MHADHAVFLDAIASRHRLSVTFFSRKEGKELVRVCAPLDFGPLRGAKEPADHYQLWDLEGKRKPLNIAVLPADVVKMTVLGETFDPAEIITWAFKPGAWRIARDWGQFS